MNYMKQVANMLGVELGEEFKVCESDAVFKITETGFQFKCAYGWGWADSIIYEDLLTGNAEIIKLLWKPEKGERYWCFSHTGNPIKMRWDDDFGDRMNYAIGNCHRTKEEALANAKNLLERIKKIAEDSGRHISWED